MQCRGLSSGQTIGTIHTAAPFEITKAGAALEPRCDNEVLCKVAVQPKGCAATLRLLLLLQNDVLCIGFEIQRWDCLFIRSLADSAKKHRVQTAVFPLSISQALGDLRRIRNQNISYSVVVLF